MIGLPLDALDGFGVFQVEVPVDAAQVIEPGGVHTGQRRQGQFAKRDEVLDFHTHPVADEGAFRKVGGQILNGTAVSAIHGRNGFQGRKFHDMGRYLG